jgi:hypothetical protein
LGYALSVGIVDKGSQTVEGMLAEAEEGEEILSNN